jgi:hypothetical protein
MKTSELTDTALDWAVAKAKGHEIESLRGGAVWYWLKCSLTGALEVVEVFSPSTNWAHGGPIIEREGIWLKHGPSTGWEAIHGLFLFPNLVIGTGPTPLIAAMRCYVASKMGDTVDIPEGIA